MRFFFTPPANAPAPAGPIPVPYPIHIPDNPYKGNGPTKPQS